MQPTSLGFFANAASTDARYGTFTEVHNVQNTTIHGDRSSEDRQALAALAPAERSGYFVHPCKDGTRQDIFTEVDHWLDDQDAPNVLLILGSASAGKSVLASSLVAKYTANRRFGSRFFFKRETAILSDPVALWRTVAYDLAKFDAFAEILIEIIKDSKFDPGWSDIRLHFKCLIQEPLTKTFDRSPPHIIPVVIIDALDECGSDPSQEAHRRALLDTFLEWSKLPKAFKLIITSRDEAIPDTLRIACKQLLLPIYKSDVPNILPVVQVQTAKKPSFANPFRDHTEPVTCVAFSPDGKKVASSSHDRTIRIWNLEIGSVGAAVCERHRSGIASFAFSPDSKRVVSGSLDGTVMIWDAETGDVIAGPLGGDLFYISSVTFLPDSETVAACMILGGEIRTWDMEKGYIAGPFEDHRSQVLCVAFSPDGKRLVSGLYDSAIQIWDVEVGAVTAGPFEGHTGGVSSVSFSPDGKRFVSGSYDNTVRIWDVEKGRPATRPFKGHTDWIGSVAFSADGKWVVSGSADGEIRIWNVEMGCLAAGPFKGHTGKVNSVAFSPDGKRVISGSEDTTMRILDVERVLLLHVQRLSKAHAT